MSVLGDLPRAPAHAGMLPLDPAFVPASAEMSALVMSAVPEVTAVEEMRLHPAAQAPARFFRVKQQRGRVPLFLKLMELAEYRTLAETDKIVARLPDECAAVRPCGVYPAGDPAGRVIVAYPYLDARYLSPTPADLRALGRSIAALHEGLRRAGEYEPIKFRAHERARRLDGVLRAEKPHRRLLDAADIPNLTAGIELAMQGSAVQPLHGDLNAGNILCLRSDGIRFLDFEDARHSFGPPLLDLALPLERFCLLLDDEEAAISAARTFLGSYARAAGAAPIEAPGALSRSLRAINERAVGLLIERHEAGLESSLEEWRKFGVLLRGHAARGGVIAAIERAFL